MIVKKLLISVTYVILTVGVVILLGFLLYG